MLNKLPNSEKAPAQATAKSVSYRTLNELPHTEQATARGTSYRTLKKLPNTEEATAYDR